MTFALPRARRAALTLVAGLTLAACAPTGTTGGMGGGGMGGGGMGGGGMGGGGMGGGARDPGIGGGEDEHDEGQAPEPVAGARDVTVEAGDLYFEPDTLRVEAGEPANITVTNVGNAFHDFTVADLDFMIDVPAGATATGGLTVDEPGEYAFECTVPGHAAAGMTGTLVVTE
jgi:plastocyanin